MSIILLLVGLISSSKLVSYIAERWVEEIFSSPVRSLEKNQPKIPPNHWKAEFFRNPDLKGNPVFVEDWGDSNKGFSRDWQSSSPSSNMPLDNFSVRISTEERDFDPGRYLIKAAADDGIQVLINNQSIIDKWNSTDYLRCHSFHSEGRKYPVRVEYREDAGAARLSFDIQPQPYKSASACKFIDPSLDSSLGWNSGFFRWDKNQREPSVKFYENEANQISVVNLGSNQRSDGKYGIEQNWGIDSPKEDSGIPTDFWVVRSYTQAYFEKGKTYRARIRASGGFQLLAKHQFLPDTDPNKSVYFTPKDEWQYTDGGYKDIQFTVPNDGKYDFHFHLYKRTGNAYIDLSWEEVTPSKSNP